MDIANTRPLKTHGSCETTLSATPLAFGCCKAKSCVCSQPRAFEGSPVEGGQPRRGMRDVGLRGRMRGPPQFGAGSRLYVAIHGRGRVVGRALFLLPCGVCPFPFTR